MIKLFIFLSVSIFLINPIDLLFNVYLFNACDKHSLLYKNNKFLDIYIFPEVVYNFFTYSPVFIYKVKYLKILFFQVIPNQTIVFC